MNTITDITATYNEQVINEIFQDGDASDDVKSARTQDYYDRQPQAFKGLSRYNEPARELLKKYVNHDCCNRSQSFLEDDLRVIREEVTSHIAYRTVVDQLRMLPNDLVIDFLVDQFDALGVENFYEEYGISHPDNFA